MTNLQWQDAIRTKPRKGEENLCLLWVHDVEINISYTSDELGYWDGSQWMRYDPLKSQPLHGVIVVQWCYVPRGRRGVYKQP